MIDGVEVDSYAPDVNQIVIQLPYFIHSGQQRLEIGDFRHGRANCVTITHYDIAAILSAR